MLIRNLEKNDFKDYIKLVNEFRPIGIEINKETFENIYDIIMKNSIIYVVEVDNKIIGAATLIIEQKFIHKLAKYGHIEDVIINKNYRNNNYGTKLIKHIIDYCIKHNFFKITLNCKEEFINFYKKNNFEIYQKHMSYLL